MRRKLSKNWKPSERDYELMIARGIPEEWIGHQIPEWRAYWIETGYKKAAWGTTFRNWVYRLWEQVDKSRYYREQPKPEILKKLQPAKEPERRPVLSLKKRNKQADEFFSQIKLT